MQVEGGSVLAKSAGTSVSSNVPTGDALMKAPTAGVGTPGFVVMRGSLDIPSIDELSDDVSRRKKNLIASTISPVQNYDYFYSLYSMNSTMQTDTNWADVVNKINNSLPAASGRENVYYLSGAQTLTTELTVPAGHSATVFIDGNTIVARRITVEEGGFFALISSDRITFTTGRMDYTSRVSYNDGVYITDGAITLASGASKFIGAGTFVGYGGIVNNRDLGASNLQYPSALFLARPDFVLNAPDEMKKPIVTWKEVNP
jgi:hypothetical protein